MDGEEKILHQDVKGKNLDSLCSKSIMEIA
jgi:hypothetical protein